MEEDVAWRFTVQLTSSPKSHYRADQKVDLLLNRMEIDISEEMECWIGLHGPAF